MFVVYLIILPFSPYISAHPLLETRSSQNATTRLNSTTSGWVDTPNVRGTFDLLLSCLTTLSLCAWTAYHPNVRRNSSPTRQFGHRLLWMSIAILAPELVLYCAWDQWWAARELRDDVNKLGAPAFDESLSLKRGRHDADECTVCSRTEHSGTDHRSGARTASSSVNPSQNPSDSCAEASPEQADLAKANQGPLWTTEQSFFALSGGYAVNTSAFSHIHRVIFTPAGIRLLASLGLLPNDSPEAVADKSKADIVAKALVCMQAGWFFVQCIARLAQKLPLTLFEVHVLSHVMCAFGMYLLWINKPYNVGSPIDCSDERVVDLGALFALDDLRLSRRHEEGDILKCSQVSSVQLSEVSGSLSIPIHRSSIPKYIQAFAIDADRDAHRRRAMLRLPKHSFPPPPPPLVRSQKTKEHLLRANRALAYLKGRDVHLRFLSKGTPYRLILPTPASEPEELTITEHHLHTGIRFPVTYIVDVRSNLYIDGTPGGAIRTRTMMDESNTLSTPANEEYYDKLTSLQVKAYAIMSILYGAIHLAAWNYAFPSIAEMWLWRASGLIMAGTPPIIIFGYLLQKLLDYLFGKAPFKEDHWAWWRKLGFYINRYLFLKVVALLMVLGIVIFMVGYPFARILVLGESFAALRRVDAGVWKTVQWTGFWPHVG